MVNASHLQGDLRTVGLSGWVIYGIGDQMDSIKHVRGDISYPVVSPHLLRSYLYVKNYCHWHLTADTRLSSDASVGGQTYVCMDDEKQPFCTNLDYVKRLRKVRASETASLLTTQPSEGLSISLAHSCSSLSPFLVRSINSPFFLPIVFLFCPDMPLTCHCFFLTHISSCLYLTYTFCHGLTLMRCLHLGDIRIYLHHSRLVDDSGVSAAESNIRLARLESDGAFQLGWSDLQIISECIILCVLSHHSSGLWYVLSLLL